MIHKTAIVMPLKAESERVKDKNFRTLGDKPLYRWAMDKLLTLNCDTFVYGDDAAWNKLDRHTQNEVSHLHEDRPALTNDSNDFFCSIAHALPKEFTRIVYANATSPFVTNKTYGDALRIFESGWNTYDSVLSAIPVYGRVWNNDAQSLNHDPKTCPRTQNQDPVWIESDAFWMLDRTLITNHHRRVGMCPYFQVVSGWEKIDINVPSDLDFAREMLATTLKGTNNVY
jgi:CMP-N-acetylneuraminic acid synthetase